MRTATLAVAAALLLAGCTGALPGGDAAEGTVNVYVSDEANAIDEFEHLNVTITAFSLRSADSVPEHDDDGHHRHRHHRGNWTTYDINETTVDLTELQGANASLLHTVDVPDGDYTGVSVEVASVNATLKNGETPKQVKVPNDRLFVPKEFTVGNNESVDFVVDAVVKERRDNETYVIKPNLDASGTDVKVRCDCDCPHKHGSGDHHDGHHGGNETDDGGHHGGHHGGNQTDGGCHG